VTIGVRTRAGLYLALIFLCGALSGALGMRWLQRSSVSADTSATTKTGQVRLGAVHWFSTQLDLNPEQVDQLNKIIEQTRSQYKEHEMEIESIKQHGRVRIREILNDEQKAKFDQLLADRARREKDKDKHESR
jgi:Spy/CpxP family protein refolding chaperone